jgi:aminoglycoside phosphotransferase (APT) family kinase protein
MSELTAATIEEGLEGRLTDGPVAVSDVVAHTEGWSRDTVSFTATWTEGGREREERYVLRVENEDPATGTAAMPRLDVEREYEVMTVAGEATEYVPDTVTAVPADGGLGRRAFVAEHRPGDAPVTWDEDDRTRLYAAWDDPAKTLPHQFVEALADIHAVEADAVPFLDAVDPGDAAEREIETWISVYRDVAIATEPALEEAIRWFRANRPTVPETTLLHGDYRIGNLLVEDREVTAVLDWELARVGDPLFDLGYASTRYFAGKLVSPIERPELACSLLEREWFYDEYERLTGRAVDRERVRYWQAFAAFIMLTISLAGVDRYRRDEADDVRSAWLQYTVPGLTEDILAIVREDRTVS